VERDSADAEMRVTLGDVFVGIAAIAGGTGLLLSYRSSLAAHARHAAIRRRSASARPMPGVNRIWWQSSRGEKFQDLRLNILPTRTPTLGGSLDELRGIRLKI
jgi:hypothetical protein